MKQDHQQFKDLQFKELPAPLPVGERVIWQGKPTFKGLALRSFHIREVAIYFGLLLVWRLWSNWSHGVPPADAAMSALWLIVPAASAIAVLAALAWLFRRAACYTITSKRVLFQFGVALPHRNAGDDGSGKLANKGVAWAAAARRGYYSG